MPGRPATPEERHADADFSNYASEAEAVAAAVPAEPQLAVAALGGLQLTDDIDAMSFSEEAAPPAIDIEAPAAGSVEPSADDGRARV